QFMIPQSNSVSHPCIPPPRPLYPCYFSSSPSHMLVFTVALFWREVLACAMCATRMDGPRRRMIIGLSVGFCLSVSLFPSFLLYLYFLLFEAHPVVHFVRFSSSSFFCSLISLTAVLSLFI
ncbi:hypothetical protein BDP27DRAFT_1331679, partial [Rhodocollybia butyracea]